MGNVVYKICTYDDFCENVPRLGYNWVVSISPLELSKIEADVGRSGASGAKGGSGANGASGASGAVVKINWENISNFREKNYPYKINWYR